MKRFFWGYNSLCKINLSSMIYHLIFALKMSQYTKGRSHEVHSSLIFCAYLSNHVFVKITLKMLTLMWVVLANSRRWFCLAKHVAPRNGRMIRSQLWKFWKDLESLLAILFYLVASYVPTYQDFLRVSQ